METNFSKLSISDKDTDTVNNKNCSYCNKPFTEELWCCINFLEKLAENGNEEAMLNLANNYRNGEGTEKNLEKAFQWYQKAAENGNGEAMHNLANSYCAGEGTEQDFPKSIYWYQEAAENGVKEAMYILASIGDNEEEAFYWYQKAAESGHTYAMANLVRRYYFGKGTEKNPEKAFYWCQKAVENDAKDSMFILALCYRDGVGTEKNLEKAYYWLQKAAENGDKKAMYNLANGYYNGNGTEKNLEKAFYLYKKAAENGDDEAMNNLAMCYKAGEGTEKNLEKAFYWYQKAAVNGINEAMLNLALCYKTGSGTEKNLEKAFYLYQKVAENNVKEAMHNLSLCYETGSGTEKNLEKAFYWSERAAVNGVKEAMLYLAICYKNGKGTEMYLEKAFYWYQKAAENGNGKAMYDLSLCYENGKGTEKNLEKAFYWRANIIESSEINVFGIEMKAKLCNECKQPFLNVSDYQWCQECNTDRFQQEISKWTSNNEFIDKFIQEAQLNAKNSYEILEWIPYNKLSNISYYDKGGFSEIHKAIWSDGPIFGWNFDKQQWNRKKDYEVILKKLNNSSNLNNKFLDEWKYHYNCQKKSFSKFIQFFGITQDPDNSNYMIVMSFAEKGTLKKCLSDIIKFKWQDKLKLLKKIILGLKVIHESNLTHAHDRYLILDICKKENGKRPEIIENTPKCYVDLMEKCWDSNPSNRPTIKMLENIISKWIEYITNDKFCEKDSGGNYKYVILDIDIQLRNDMLEFIEADRTLVQEQAEQTNTSILQPHSQACYTSRKFSQSQGFDCVIED
ncbi:HCP-like protein [Rhizophagus irregularis]|nr:HCP-like protein [Rhizophagus irregularis]